MKLSNIQDIKGFMEAVNLCTGSVLLVCENGDSFDLKSIFSSYLAIKELRDKIGYELEVFTSKSEDTQILMRFLEENEHVL